MATPSYCIYEARYEEMATLKDGKATVRYATFLKPCVESINQAVGIPNTPLLSEIFPHNLQQWPSKVLFKGWRIPQKQWDDWIDRLAGKYGAIWNQAGICDAIMSSRYEIRCNQDLVLGLAEFWCPETSTFVFPWGEATVTLEDVMILGGFSVLGQPVTRPITGQLVKIVEGLDMKRMEMSREKSRKATHGGWIKHFMESESEFEHVAFLSLWLSRYVFPSSDSTIGKHVFSIAVHLSCGTRIALAPAILASLYKNLKKLKKQAVASKEAISVLGPFQLVQLWALERFPSLGPSLPKTLHPGEPRAARWNKVNSRNNLQVVRSVLKVAENFQWRPYAADLMNWHHTSYYKDTEQFVFDWPNLDEELQSFVRCLLASELVGLMDCTEKYSPQRVAMQFGMDQDLPGDFSGLEFNLENVRFYVPPRSFVPSVSLRYLNWWKTFKSNCADVIKEYPKLITLKNRTLPLIQAKTDKGQCHGSLAPISMEKPKMLSSGSHTHMSRRIYNWSDDDDEFDVTLKIAQNDIAANRTAIIQTDTLTSTPDIKTGGDYHTSIASSWILPCPEILSQVSRSLDSVESHALDTPDIDDHIPLSERLKFRAGTGDTKTSNSQVITCSSSDIEDHIPLSERLKPRASIVDRRRTNSHEAFRGSQSQHLVSSSIRKQTVKKRKLATRTDETSKGKAIIPSFNPAAKHRKTNERFKRDAEVGRKHSHVVGLTVGNKQMESAKESTNCTVTEGKKRMVNGSFENPIDLDDNIADSTTGIQHLGLEMRVQLLEQLIGVIPK